MQHTYYKDVETLLMHIAYRENAGKPAVFDTLQEPVPNPDIENELPIVIVLEEDSCMTIYAPRIGFNDMWCFDEVNGMMRLFQAISNKFGSMYIKSMEQYVPVNVTEVTILLKKPRPLHGAYAKLVFTPYYPREEHPLMKSKGWNNYLGKL